MKTVMICVLSVTTAQLHLTYNYYLYWFYTNIWAGGGEFPYSFQLQICNTFNYQQRTELNVTIQSLGGANVILCYTLCAHAYMLVELLLVPMFARHAEIIMILLSEKYSSVPWAWTNFVEIE